MSEETEKEQLLREHNEIQELVEKAPEEYQGILKTEDGERMDQFDAFDARLRSRAAFKANNPIVVPTAEASIPSFEKKGGIVRKHIMTPTVSTTEPKSAIMQKVNDGSKTDWSKIEAALASALTEAQDDDLLTIFIQGSGPFTSDQKALLQFYGCSFDNNAISVTTGKLSKTRIQALSEADWVQRLSLSQTLKPTLKLF